MKVSIKRQNGDSWDLEGTPQELVDFVGKNWFGFFPLASPAPIADPVIGPFIFGPAIPSCTCPAGSHIWMTGGEVAFNQATIEPSTTVCPSA